MCVSTGPRICLLCLLLYSWQGKAEDSGISGKGQQYDDQHTKTTEDEDGLYFMEKDYFLTKLMDKYGNGVEMTYEGFEHLLYHLGLGGIVKFDHGISCHKEENGSEFLQIHLHHNHSVEATPSSKMCAHEEEHSHYDHDHDDHAHNEHNHEDGENHNEHEHHTLNETLHGDGDHDHDHSHEHDDHEHSPGDNEHSPNEHDHMHDAKGTNSDIHGHSEHEQIDHEQNGNVEENLDHEHTTNISTTDTHLHDDGDTHEHDHGQEDDHGEHDHEHHVHKRHIEHNECLPPSVLLHIVHSDDHQTKLTKENFKEICPILIYQIDADSCHSSNSHKNDHEIHGDKDGFHGDHDHDHNEDHDHAAHSDSAVIDLAKVPAKVWGFSTIAVIIISLVGLLGVAVIPIMQKVFYNHMLQFLVALAVGALSGDALLHLFPHAIAGGHGDEHGGHDHSGEEHAHDPAPIYKGLLGLFGIYFFFFTERALTMFTEYKRKKKQKRNRKKYFKDEELVKVGERLAKSECDGMMMSIHPNKALRGYADETHTEHCIISLENTTKISHEHGQRQNCHAETCVDGDENTSMIGSTNSTPVSHGHGHGHSHAADGVPTSVASVAWMVIMGDGIHNFSDGLAIGAAFVNSITGGFSTSIAVFCHELPHEIGDFAMLLRAGMSPKQAIIYNCLSSILCFFGMLIGVAIGNLEGASLWIFSIVGGMFLYIALVDMLPELSSVETKKGEHPLCHLLLQGIGMCIGAGIMLAIALYEGELKTLLE